MSLRTIYEEKYKQLLIIPFGLLFVALILLGMNYSATGDFVNKGISLEGGTSFSLIQEGLTADEVESVLLYDGDMQARTLSGAGKTIGVVIEIDSVDSEIISAIEAQLRAAYNLGPNDITVETIGSSLGESFFQETMKAMLIAFAFMGIVVFLYFRTIVPSIAVILAAVSDIIITIAISNLIGIKLSTAGIAAFLMLIGYSVDSDILLTTKVLKTKVGTVNEKVYRAMKTGLMMSITTIVAVSIALIFTQSPIIKQIMLILLIGLGVDLIMTWLQNVGLLKWHLSRRKDA